MTPPTFYDIIILAGGESSRFGYVDKCTFNYLGRPMICRLLEEFDDAFVASREFRGLKKGIEIIERGKREGPIGGIKAVLPYINKEKVFITGCDFPHVNRRVADYICRDDFDISMVILEDVQPLLACYKTELLRKYIDKVSSLRELLDYASSIRFIGSYELGFVDLELSSIKDINTLEDLLNNRFRIFTIGKIIFK